MELYIQGVTNNLIRRIYEHKNKLADGFTKKYNINLLVYYECFESISDAIVRERKIKYLKRMDKLVLIEGFNPTWRDLYYEIV